MFTFTFDSHAGILRLRCAGKWTLPDVERYGPEAGRQFTQARLTARRLRLLIDVTEQEILSQDVVEPLARAGMQHGRADDRVALVVTSTLMKLQMKRMIGDAPTPIYLSESEALAWLSRPDETASLASA